MRKITKTGIALLVLILLVVGSLAYFRAKRSSGNHEKITFAVSPQTLSLPLYVASAKGFFEREGLQVIWKPYESGRDTLNATLEGAADLCSTADTPLMFAALKGGRFLILATIADSNKYDKVIARRSRGISKPTDLEGKTIAFWKGTSAEFYLQAYLAVNGITSNRVRLVAMSPQRTTEALVKGEIDAAATFPPFDMEQQKSLGADSVMLENEHLYKVTWNLAGRPDFVRAHPEAIKKLLRAVIQATHYIAQNSGEAGKIAADYIGKDAADFRDYDYDVRMDRTLLVSLEEEARWAIAAGLTDKREIPNYLNFFYPDDLEAVAPESVALKY